MGDEMTPNMKHQAALITGDNQIKLIIVTIIKLICVVTSERLVLFIKGRLVLVTTTEGSYCLVMESRAESPTESPRDEWLV